MFKPPRPQIPLRFRYNVISTEALSVHKPMASTVSKLTGFINDVTKSISDASILGAIEALINPSKPMTKDERKVTEMLASVPYTDIRDLKVPCVAGITVPWLKLLQDLEPGIHFATNFYEATLGEINRFLADVISNPENMKAIARRFSIQSNDFEKLLEDIGKDLTGNNKSGVAPVGKLLQRNSDFIQVVQLTNGYSNSLFSANPSLVTERIDVIKKQLQTISDGISDPSLPYRMSGDNISQLANVTYTAAKSIEYYGVILSVFTEHRRTFEQAVDKLAKLR